jgi:hypothetical protein
MLRDILTYKARNLRMQQRTFKGLNALLAMANTDGMNAENRAVKRELLDYISTLFKYL